MIEIHNSVFFFSGEDPKFVAPDPDPAQQKKTRIQRKYTLLDRQHEIFI